ncbi:amino acid permease [Clostridium rectalis]|uniref:amino acid permease n=1 Tax=Clostridium rectalis TaxID=2040295 RepID=UPI000F641D06|nr:amino acid permease [Clostridium rectalis]
MGENNEKKLGLGLLIALGIGSMIASGIFNSPTDLISTSNPQAVLIAWCIGVFGVIMLALVFNILSNKRPELKGGIYSYARAGYGPFIGFNCAWGYWMSSFLGNVSFIILIFKTINSLIGSQYKMPPVVIFVLGSVLLWSYYFIIRRGIKEAGVLNVVITIAKIVPLILVIIFGALAFKGEVFFIADWKNILASTGEATTIGKQVSGAMGTVLWCFVGVEALVVLSERAETQQLVGRATVISLLATATLYVSISILSMGVVPAKVLVGSTTPLADVLLATSLGKAGAVIIKLGIIISNIGALLCWNLLTTEILYVPAVQDDLMPQWFKKTNQKNVPINALLFTIGAIQIFLFALLSPALQKGYYIATHVATTNILLPYLISSMFAFKVYKGEQGCLKEKLIALIAVLYSIYVIYAVGIAYLGLAFIMYSTGIVIYVKGKREKNESITNKEKLYITILLIVSIIMIILAATGRISV